MAITLTWTSGGLGPAVCPDQRKPGVVGVVGVGLGHWEFFRELQATRIKHSQFSGNIPGNRPGLDLARAPAEVL